MAEIDIYDIVPRVTLTKIEVPARERPEEDAEEKARRKRRKDVAKHFAVDLGDAAKAQEILNKNQ